MKNLNIESLIFSLIPISYILGIVALNINFFLLLIYSLINIKNTNKFFNLKLIDKIVIIFFLYLLIVGIINAYEAHTKPFYLTDSKSYSKEYSLGILFKSIFYFKSLLVYFALRLLFEKQIINIKIFFFVSAIITLLVSIDIIFQYLNSGTNLLGMKTLEINNMILKYSGVFGEEQIAGSFLQRFGFFLLILLLNIEFFFDKENKLKKLLFVFSFFLILISIFISGNRMPFMLFLMCSFLMLLHTLNLKKYFLVLISLILISTFMLVDSKKFDLKQYIYYESTPQKVRTLFVYYDNLKNNVYKIVNAYKNKVIGEAVDLKYEDRPSHMHEFDNGIGTWKMNKIIGGGINSYWWVCIKRNITDINERTTCDSHPHNYYLEIMSELGLIGLLFSLFFFFFTIKHFFSITSKDIRIYALPFYLILIAEFFPIKSSGSFFYSLNSYMIFFSMAVLFSLKKN